MDHTGPAGGLPPCCCHAQHLTDRELDVLCQVATGATNNQIAGQLDISGHTVAGHVQAMMVRTSARTRAELAARAYAAGILLPDTWPPARSGRRCLDIPGLDRVNGSQASPAATPAADGAG
jgi:DNA-binding CsgD family transcriptional regulator